MQLSKLASISILLISAEFTISFIGYTEASGPPPAPPRPPPLPQGGQIKSRPIPRADPNAVSQPANTGEGAAVPRKFVPTGHSFGAGVGDELAAKLKNRSKYDNHAIEAQGKGGGGKVVESTFKYKRTVYASCSADSAALPEKVDEVKLVPMSCRRLVDLYNQLERSRGFPNSGCELAIGGFDQDPTEIIAAICHFTGTPNSRCNATTIFAGMGKINAIIKRMNETVSRKVSTAQPQETDLKDEYLMKLYLAAAEVADLPGRPFAERLPALVYAADQVNRDLILKNVQDNKTKFQWIDAWKSRVQSKTGKAFPDVQECTRMNPHKDKWNLTPCDVIKNCLAGISMYHNFAIRIDPSRAVIPISQPKAQGPVKPSEPITLQDITNANARLRPSTQHQQKQPQYAPQGTFEPPKLRNIAQPDQQQQAAAPPPWGNKARKIQQPVPQQQAAEQPWRKNLRTTQQPAQPAQPVVPQYTAAPPHIPVNAQPAARIQQRKLPDPPQKSVAGRVNVQNFEQPQQATGGDNIPAWKKRLLEKKQQQRV